MEMATTVALEMEEKRRKEEWEKMEEENRNKVKKEKKPMHKFSSSFGISVPVRVPS